MADSGGHWANIDELKKLSSSLNIPGRQEEDIKRVNPLDIFPVTQASGVGTSIKSLVEKTTTEGAAAFLGVGGQTSWSEDIAYETRETELAIVYMQRKLDKFVRDIYTTFNNYEAMITMEMIKGLRYKIGDEMIYGDRTYGAQTTMEFSGLHRMVAYNKETFTLFDDNLNIDEGNGALSIRNLRLMLDAMKLGTDILLFPGPIAQRIDEMWEDVGLVALKADTASTSLGFSRGIDQWGMPFNSFRGVPIIRTDFLVEETADTGTGASSNTRAKYADSGGTASYSIFGLKFGNPLAGDPGVSLAFGNTEAQGQFFTVDPFDRLETYIAKGVRLYSFLCMLQGSCKSIGRIYDVTDDALTA